MIIRGKICQSHSLSLLVYLISRKFPNEITINYFAEREIFSTSAFFLCSLLRLNAFPKELSQIIVNIKIIWKRAFHLMPKFIFSFCCVNYFLFSCRKALKCYLRSNFHYLLNVSKYLPRHFCSKSSEM